MRFSTCNKVLSLAIVFLLGACGGGGGGGFAPVVYQGNTAQARISPANAQQISGNVVESMTLLDDGFFEIPGPKPDAGLKQADYVKHAIGQIAQIRDRLIKQESARRSQSAYAQRDTINETISCDSGTFRVNGFTEDDGTGTLTATFSNCEFAGVRLHGQLILQILSVDPGTSLDTSVRINVVSLTLSSPGFSVSLSANISYLVEVPQNRETETVHSLVIRDNGSGEMVQVLNLVSVVTYDDITFFTSPNSASVAITSGRVYHSLHGYVVIVTTTPLNYTTIGQLYPDAGVIQLSGNASNIRITALDEIQVLIEVDADGDLVYESNTMPDWADL